MINENITENAALLQCIKDLCASDRDFMLISLCTTDGFPISYFSTHVSSDHADKFAAMSSTILALSDSSASQMNQGQCNITIIEATSGNTLFVKELGQTFEEALDLALEALKVQLKKFKEKLNDHAAPVRTPGLALD